MCDVFFGVRDSWFGVRGCCEPGPHWPGDWARSRSESGPRALSPRACCSRPRLALLRSPFVVVTQHVHGRGDGGANIGEVGADPLVVSCEQHLCRGLLGWTFLRLQDLLNQGVRLLRDASRRFDHLPPRARSRPLSPPRRRPGIGSFAAGPPARQSNLIAGSNACGGTR